MAQPVYDRDYAGASEDGAAIDVSAADYSGNFRRLFVGGAGNVKIVTARGNDLLYTTVPAGTYLNIQGSKVYHTGTTATLIVAEF